MNLSQNSLHGFASVAAFVFVVCQFGCATIVSEKRYPVTINNVHGPTFFSVEDRKNNVIHQGVTPQQVTLDAKAFPFWPAKYTVVYAGENATTQRREVRAGFDPWVAGNLVLGGGAGAIVDGATGAMFKLPKNVDGDVAAQYAVTDSYRGSQLAGIGRVSGAGGLDQTPGSAVAASSVPVQSSTMRSPDISSGQSGDRTASAASDTLLR